LHIRKFFSFASPHIASPQIICTINPQIANLQISYVCQSANRKSANFYDIATLHQNSPKSCLLGEFVRYKFELENFKPTCIFVKNVSLCICGSLSPQKQIGFSNRKSKNYKKECGSQISNPQIGGRYE
jgi:hypothetical protein